MKIDGRYLKDESGRILVLRGVNLGGSSKVPFSPDGSTWNREGFYEHRTVSFVGRPFPLAQADEHFARLKAWGFDFLRFLVTWEAVEHSGPGLYDEAYLDYLRLILLKAHEHGIRLFIDPHQDVWSRFTGGDGAPGWTLEAVGFDPRHLHASGAAILHQEHGDPFPPMIWPTNNNKLAAATMFTLFFAGDDFAPQLKVDGLPVQEYLQSHYIAAVKQVALRLQDLPNVVGYDTLNEPSAGYIGQQDLNLPALAVNLKRGETPTAFQSMLLGSGFPQHVETWDLGLTGFRRTGSAFSNPSGVSAWLPGYTDIWRGHGVWDLDFSGKPVLLHPAYFHSVHGRAVDFHADYFRPFANRFAREIRSVVPGAIIFVEGVPSQGELCWTPEDAPDIVHAAHWYDDLTLVNKDYNPWMAVDAQESKIIFGPSRVRKSLHYQIGRIADQADRQMNHAPALVGEVGIPFDMHNGRDFKTGNFSSQVKALDATMTALEGNFASFTLWNYTSDNTNRHGDQWNGEDLSLYSRDQATGDGSIYDGGRALKAALRPYPRAIAGWPISMSFKMKKALFEFTFRHDPAVSTPTELFIPACQYPRGFVVEVSDGSFQFDEKAQCLAFHHSPDRDTHTLRLRPKK